jgi:uncharacterized protein YqhQ
MSDKKEGDSAFSCSVFMLSLLLVAAIFSSHPIFLKSVLRPTKDGQALPSKQCRITM